MAFDLSNYETVDSRINRFYEKNPNGRITTELIAYSDQAFIVKAFVYRDLQDVNVSATGLAEERVGASTVNRTSALENCETSAIGRALANLNFASKGQRASLEEMEKVSRYETATGPVPREEWKNTAQGSWAEVGKATDKQLKFVHTILSDAFKSAGFGDKGIDYSMLKDFFKVEIPITKLEDITRKQASILINDKMSSTGTTKLLEFLQGKQDPNLDPWASPAF
jgi:hypothetical protein